MEMQCRQNLAGISLCPMVHPFEQEFLFHTIRDILVYDEMLDQTMTIVGESLLTPSCKFNSLIQAVLDVNDIEDSKKWAKDQK